MSDLTDIRALSKLILSRRSYIIKDWLEQEEVRSILHKHSISLAGKNQRYFHGFAECFFNIIDSGVVCSECKIRINFLQLINSYNMTLCELFILIAKLRATIERTIYESFALSYALSNRIDSLALKWINELSLSYEIIQRGEKRER